MTHLGYILAGYLLTAAVLGGYILRIWSRTRALARVSRPPAAGAPVTDGSPPPATDP